MGLTTVLTILNQTATQKSYVIGNIILPASGQVNVSSGLLPFLAVDPSFINDLTLQDIQLSDGVQSYSGSTAIDFITKYWISGQTPQNSNEAVAFALAGYGFSLTADASLSTTSETDLLLLVNPSNSGFNARALAFYANIDSTQGILTSRFYTNPTISSNGTDISSTINNNLVQNGSPASIMKAYAAPTISNRGNKRISLVSAALNAAPKYDFQQTAILAPGSSILLTGQASNLGILASIGCHFFFEWVEV